MNLLAAQSSRLTLTARDQALIATLSRRLVVMSVDQAARLWWPGTHSRAACARRLRALHRAGWVRRFPALTAAIPRVEEPLAHWTPGEPEPDMAAVVRVARRRLNGPCSAVDVITASAPGCARTGGSPRPIRASDIAHDLMLAEVFITFAELAPGLADRWVLAGDRGHRGERVADAVVARPGRSLHIEVVGSSYTPTKLLLIHRHCEAHGLEYLLW